jgi:hypothetical protein
MDGDAAPGQDWTMTADRENDVVDMSAWLIEDVRRCSHRCIELGVSLTTLLDATRDAYIDEWGAEKWAEEIRGMRGELQEDDETWQGILRDSAEFAEWLRQQPAWTPKVAQ